MTYLLWYIALLNGRSESWQGCRGPYGIMRPSISAFKTATCILSGLAYKAVT